MTALELDQIEAMSDSQLGLYALVGYCVNLAALIERVLFASYAAASNVPETEASAIFYRFVNFEHKRHTTDAAVRATLVQDDHVDRWQQIMRDMQRLMGPEGSIRNLVSHNRILLDVAITYHSPEDFVGSTSDLSTVEVDTYLEQNRHQVAAGRRPYIIVRKAELVHYARGLIDLLERLDTFLPSTVGIYPTHY
jgi:hypothetical protein